MITTILAIIGAATLLVIVVTFLAICFMEWALKTGFGK